ncbi:MAG: nuclear transport factor 2 family protein [Pseudomonadota bacterium]
MTCVLRAVAFMATAALCQAALAAADLAALRQQVFEAERAFAKSMADRDHAAFARFVAEEAVFFSGPTPLRGRQAVVDGWKRFFDKPQAPFSWEPDQVEVLDSGTLAHSSGPVRDPGGKLTGRFNSIWRQEAPGVWRVVFDRGEGVCDCAQQQKP